MRQPGWQHSRRGKWYQVGTDDTLKARGLISDELGVKGNSQVSGNWVDGLSWER